MDEGGSQSRLLRDPLFPQLLAEVFHGLAHLAAGFAEAGLDLAARALVGAFVFEDRIAHRPAHLFLHSTARLVDVAFYFVVIDAHGFNLLRSANNSRILP